MDRLGNQYTRGYTTINLDAICYNMESMKHNLKETTSIYGIVKADGYGHGAVPVAKTIDPYVIGYGVATVEEALSLRMHGIQKPILILGVTHPSHFYNLAVNNIRPTIFQLEKAKLLSEVAVKLQKKVKIHIALDTGMGRIGMEVTPEGAEEAAAISRLKGIELEGVFTHFAKADESDKSYTKYQLEQYLRFIDYLKEKGISVPICHCSNSAGIIDIREANIDAVRAGISIYGLYPSPEVDKGNVSLKPALEFKSQITYVKTLEAGKGISYGSSYITVRDTKVATIPIGYGDGYPRSLSGKGFVLINGQKAPVLGRICMDQFMADVTDIPNVKEEDTVTLIGRDGTNTILVEDLSRLSGVFHYELVCNLGKRIPRVYLKNDKVVSFD